MKLSQVDLKPIERDELRTVEMPFDGVIFTEGMTITFPKPLQAFAVPFGSQGNTYRGLGVNINGDELQTIPSKSLIRQPHTDAEKFIQNNALNGQLINCGSLGDRMDFLEGKTLVVKSIFKGDRVQFEKIDLPNGQSKRVQKKLPDGTLDLKEFNIPIFEIK